MASVTLKGNPVDLYGELPESGSKAPDFSLIKTDMSEIKLSDFAGKKLVLNIFPSIDTPVCQQSVRTFNQAASKYDDTVVLCVSADLPFAQSRFCGAQDIENVVMGSVFRSPSFAQDYGVGMTSGPLMGLLARAVVVVDTNGNVIHRELVPEIAEEPDYDEALNALAQ